jgi:hypothetical protein
MTRLYVRSERLVKQPSNFVHHLFADFVNHHPKFLPPSFINLNIESGGYGAGTVYTFSNRARAFRMLVTEPDPGRILIEHDQLSNLETTFTFMPEGEQTRITFETAWESASGLPGVLEAWFAPMLMRGLYRDELNRFEAYANGLQRTSPNTNSGAG